MWVHTLSSALAHGLMQALRQYQLRCPDDIGLVTCDDHPWLDAFSPRLTTINLPKYDLGRQAAELLVDTIQPPAATPKRRAARVVTLKTSLRIRESCGYELRAAARLRAGSEPSRIDASPFQPSEPV